MTTHSLVLASSSPRRKEILSGLGLTFEVRVVGIEEARGEGESADSMVVRLAQEKAVAASEGQNEIIVAADTAVVLGDAVFGKPTGEADAMTMLSLLSGRSHTVVTGVAVFDGQQMHTAISKSEVRFRSISEDEARRYWSTGEPADKAGAYAIQGLGGVFVESMGGSYSGIVGLPVYETAELLRVAGYPILPE